MENADIALIVAMLVWGVNGIIWSMRILAGWQLNKHVPVWAHIMAAISFISVVVLAARLTFPDESALFVYSTWAFMGAVVLFITIVRRNNNAKNS